jgi:hypothetical protein
MSSSWNWSTRQVGGSAYIRSGRRQLRRATCTCLLALFCLFSQQTSAGNIFSEVTASLGEVTKGLGNVLGQGISGLAAPTINDFTDAANGVVARTLQLGNDVLAQRITQLDEAAKARLSQVDVLANHLLDKLNSDLTSAIDQIDKILDDKIGSAQVAVQRATFSLQNSLLTVAFYFVAVVFIAALAFLMIRRSLNRGVSGSPSSKQVLTGLGFVAATSIVVVVALYILKIPLSGQLLQLEAEMQSNTLKSYRAASFNNAVTYAKQLAILEPNSTKFQALEKLAEIQRDVLYRPTVLKSPRGAVGFQPKIRELDELVSDKVISGSNDELSEFVKVETDASTAVILWQLGQGLQNGQIERGLCAAINSAARFWGKNRSIGDAEANKIFVETEATPFVWLASRYLKWGSFIYREKDPPLQCQRGLQSVSFQGELKKLDKMVAAFDVASKPSSIAHIVNFDDYALEYFEKASYLYSALIVADANFELTRGDKDPQKREWYFNARNRWADQLMDGWTQFMSKIGKDTSIAGNDIIVASIGIPAALAIRAQMIRNIPSATSRALSNSAGIERVEYSCSTVISDLQTDPANLRKQYEHYVPLPVPEAPAAKNAENINAVYSLAKAFPDPNVRLLICSQQISLDAKFYELEKKLIDVRKSGSLHDGGVAKLIHGLPGQLEVCIDGANGEPSGDLERLKCDVEQSGSFAQWIGPEKINAIQRYAMVR